jgi:hypothetical protein
VGIDDWYTTVTLLDIRSWPKYSTVGVRQVGNHRDRSMSGRETCVRSAFIPQKEKGEMAIKELINKDLDVARQTGFEPVTS